MTLNEQKIGIKCRITAVNGKGALRRRLLDMGLTPKTEVMIRKVAPMGVPRKIHFWGYALTISLEEAENVEVEEV